MRYFNPEVALKVQVPDYNSVFDSIQEGMQLGGQIKQLRQSGILSQLLAQNTDAEGKVDYNKALQAVQSNPNQSYQPAMVNTISGLIQQNNAARLKAQQDAEKFKADKEKTIAETGKITQEGLGQGLENSGKKLGAINQAFQSSALTGNKDNVLLGLNAAFKSGLIDADVFEQQKSILNLMTPDEVRVFASGLGFNNKDTAPYLFQTKNNAADNATSLTNNQNTVRATMRGQDIDAKEADKDRALKASQFNQAQSLQKWIAENKPIGTERGTDGFLYAIYPGGKGVRIPDQNGQPLKVMPKNGGQMSSATQKELFETNDAITAGTNAITNLKDAIKYSKDAYDGFGASQLAFARGMIGDGSDAATATALLDNVTKGNALDMLKATFGGAPTEGERAILLQLQGSANMPRTQREAIYDRALKMAEARIKANMEKAESLKSGSFFQSDQTNNGRDQNLFGLFD